MRRVRTEADRGVPEDLANGVRAFDNGGEVWMIVGLEAGAACDLHDAFECGRQALHVAAPDTGGTLRPSTDDEVQSAQFRSDLYRPFDPRQLFFEDVWEDEVGTCINCDQTD